MARDKKDLGTERQHKKALAGMPQLGPSKAEPQSTLSRSIDSSSVGSTIADEKVSAESNQSALAENAQSNTAKKKRYSHRIYVNVGQELQSALIARSAQIKQMANIEVTELKILSDVIAKHEDQILQWVLADTK